MTVEPQSGRAPVDASASDAHAQSQEMPALPPHAQLGNPLVEQRELAAGRALGWAPPLGVVRLEGPDAADFCARLLSRTPGTAPGDSTEALVLDATGRIRFALGLVADADGFWALCEADVAASFAAWVIRMRFRSQVTATDRSAEVSGLVRFGDPDWAPALHPVAVWCDPWGAVQPGGSQYAAPAAADYAAWTLKIALVPSDELDARRAEAVSAGAGEAGWLALEALRIAAARPRFATEVDERTLPAEVDWLRTAVQLDKGCFPGQESISKVHALGRPPRRLVRLQLDGAPDIASGAPVELDGTLVGRVTAAAVHWEMGPIALALVRRETPASAVLTVRDGDRLVSAAQEIIVPPDAAGTAAAEVWGLRRRLRAAGRAHPGASARRLH